MGQSRTFDERIGYSLLNGRDNFRREPAQVIFPTGYSASMPPGGSLRLKFVYDVGSVEQQQDIHSWTFIERVPMPGAQGDYRHVASQEFSLPPLSDAGPTTPTPAPSPSTGNGGFLGGTDAYLQLRLDTVRRTEQGFAVSLTARNVTDQRRGLQYNENPVSVLGTDGIDYPSDGNYYGRDASEMLNATVWLEKGEEAPITYVFPRLPSNVPPTRLLVRLNKNTNNMVAEFDLNRGGSTAMPAPSPQPAASGSTGFQGGTDAYFQLRLDAARRIGPGVAVTFTARNEADQRRGLQYNENRFSLLGSDGVEYRTDGNYYGPSASELLNATVWLEKGQEAPITYLFPMPSSVTPSRVRVRGPGQAVIAEFNVPAN